MAKNAGIFFGLKSVKSQLILFLVIFTIAIAGIYRNPGPAYNSLIAVLFAVLSEVAFSKLQKDKVPVTGSAVITGLIIGLVLSDSGRFWVIPAAAVFAIFSKHIIRVNNKHIFNPAAAGIVFAIAAFKAQTVWAGTYYWYILVPAGLYFAYRIRKIELLAGYFMTALLLFAVKALRNGIPLNIIFGFLSYFYIFIMLIEPKTTPAKPVSKTVFGIIAAAVIFVLTEMGLRFDVELVSLLFMNALVPVLNLLDIKQRRVA